MNVPYTSGTVSVWSLSCPPWSVVTSTDVSGPTESSRRANAVSERVAAATYFDAVPAKQVTAEIGLGEICEYQVMAAVGAGSESGFDDSVVVVKVIAAVEHELLTSRIRLDHGVEGQLAHEYRSGTTSLAGSIQKRWRVAAQRCRSVVQQPVSSRVNAPQHRRVGRKRLTITVS